MDTKLFTDPVEKHAGDIGTIGARTGAGSGGTTVTATILGALATAGVLGVTHAVEPDHVAGISSITSQYGDSRLSALVGACFSLGHVALVVVWLVGGYLLLGRTEFPAVYDTVGTVGVVVLLTVLGVLMVASGLQSLRHAHAGEHDREGHKHPHLLVPHVRALGKHAADDGEVVPHSHGHSVRTYLKTGIVGALFTLSPPVSMVVFASSLFPDYGSSVVVLAVGAYAVGITATMSAIGAGVGSAFGWTADKPGLHGGARLLGGVFVAGLALSMLPGGLPGAL